MGVRVLDFTYLLNITKYCLCSDPGDKIFALIFLIERTEKTVKINQDCTKSIYDVYQDVIVQFITIGRVTLLMTIEMHRHLERIPS